MTVMSLLPYTLQNILFENISEIKHFNIHKKNSQILRALNSSHQEV